MKILNISILIVMLITCLEAWSGKQAETGNSLYLVRLEDNILGTIDLLTAFNEKGKNIYDIIENGHYYNSFLLEMTMECGNLLQQIRNAENLTEEEQESLVRALLATLKPDVPFPEDRIGKKEDKANRQFLSDVRIGLDQQLKVLLTDILREEEVLFAEKAMTQKYLMLHSRHFLYSLLQDFVEPYAELSHANRAYLIEIIKSIEAGL